MSKKDKITNVQPSLTPPMFICCICSIKLSTQFASAQLRWQGNYLKPAITWFAHTKNKAGGGVYSFTIHFSLLSKKY